MDVVKAVQTAADAIEEIDVMLTSRDEWRYHEVSDRLSEIMGKTLRARASLELLLSQLNASKGEG